MLIVIMKREEKVPPDCFVEIAVEVVVFVLEDEVWFLRIGKLCPKAALETGLADCPTFWSDVETEPVIPFGLRKVAAQVAKKHNHYVRVVVVHAESPQAAAPQVAVFDRILFGVSVVLGENLSSKENRRQVMRRVRVLAEIVRELVGVAGMADGLSSSIGINDKILVNLRLLILLRWKRAGQHVFLPDNTAPCPKFLLKDEIRCNHCEGVFVPRAFMVYSCFRKSELGKRALAVTETDRKS